MGEVGWGEVGWGAADVWRNLENIYIQILI